MADEVVLNEAAVIQRCLERVVEECEDHEAELETNYTRQGAIVLNLLGASEAAVDLAMHATRVGKPLPQESRKVFELLEGAGWIEPDHSRRMRAMVGFRNIAVHDYDYQRLRLELVRSILENHLDDFREFSSAMIQRGKRQT